MKFRYKGDRDQHADAERGGGPAHTRQPLPLPDDLRHTRQGDSPVVFIFSLLKTPLPPLLSAKKLFVKLETIPELTKILLDNGYPNTT